MGPVRDDAARIFLRPETAQGIFVNFKNVLQFSRAQAAVRHRADRQGVPQRDQPGNFIFRSREFEQMEIEFFCRPAEATSGTSTGWTSARTGTPDLGIRPDHLRLREHGKDELSHYSPATTDVEYLFPIGWGELEGIANRTDFDLRQPRRVLGRGPLLLRPATEERYIPYVIEPSAGADRGDAGVPGRRLRRGGGRRAQAHACCACTRGWRR